MKKFRSLFSEGLVLGSREYVERAFKEKREWFGMKRKTGSHGVPVEGEGLFSLRDLKVQALESGDSCPFGLWSDWLESLAR